MTELGYVAHKEKKDDRAGIEDINGKEQEAREERLGEPRKNMADGNEEEKRMIKEELKDE
jgi:hypothetical protein